ncbi:unnamed protein product [Chrysoparadoxa australica]
MKALIIMRHSIAEHNEQVGSDPPDPSLTARGHDLLERALQIFQPQSFLRGDLEKTVAITSPLRRAVETALATLRYMGGNVKLQVDELAREAYGMKACDRRSLVSSLNQEYGGHVDFTSLQTEEDTWWRQDERESISSLDARIQAFVKGVMTKGHPASTHFLVFTHGVWMERLLLLASPYQEAHPSARVMNCEMFTLIFEQPKRCYLCIGPDVLAAAASVGVTMREVMQYCNRTQAMGCQSKGMPIATCEALMTSGTCTDKVARAIASAIVEISRETARPYRTYSTRDNSLVPLDELLLMTLGFRVDGRLLHVKQKLLSSLKLVGCTSEHAMDAFKGPNRLLETSSDG